MYEESIRGVVRSVVEGFHGSVFAYGQTNSGKTHTMSGTKSEPGVVRLAVRDVFDRIQSQTSGGEAEGREYLVSQLNDIGKYVEPQISTPFYC